jgi:hypothetical protein
MKPRSISRQREYRDEWVDVSSEMRSRAASPEKKEEGGGR